MRWNLLVAFIHSSSTLVSVLGGFPLSGVASDGVDLLSPPLPPGDGVAISCGGWEAVGSVGGTLSSERGSTDPSAGPFMALGVRTLSVYRAVRAVSAIGAGVRIVCELGEGPKSEAVPAGVVGSPPTVGSVSLLAVAGESEIRFFAHLL